MQGKHGGVDAHETSALAAKKLSATPDSTLNASSTSFIPPSTKMPSEETKVCVFRTLSDIVCLTAQCRRESSRLSTSLAYVGDSWPHKSSLYSVFHVYAGRRPLRLDSVHHLRRLHQEQPSALADQVRGLSQIARAVVDPPPSPGSLALSHDPRRTCIYTTYGQIIRVSPSLHSIEHAAKAGFTQGELSLCFDDGDYIRRGGIIAMLRHPLSL